MLEVSCALKLVHHKRNVLQGILLANIKITNFTVTNHLIFHQYRQIDTNDNK